MANEEPNIQSIPVLIREERWDEVQYWSESHPEEIRNHVDPTNGLTILHAICFTASAPTSLLKIVVDAWPGALSVQEKRFGATPLHLLCWISNRSSEKVDVLLQKMEPEVLMIRNRVRGSTALHSTCGSLSDLSVIKAIVKKHPPVLLAKTFDQYTALEALWHSTIQSITAHMQIARILKGETVTEELFVRFLSKMNFLAIETFKLSPACPELLKNGVEISCSKYILHGLLDMKAPLDAILMTLKLNPDLASHADTEGNYPLHHAVMRRPFRIKFTVLLRELLKAYPEAAEKRNAAGNTPIHIAIRERIGWEDGLGEIVDACCDVLAIPDKETGLYPFLLCASLGGNVAANTVFHLLAAKPDLVRDACN
mmetsp:Transcript_29853/g.63918  ORF Transcript_29853/g.63918 Transcript_29853/m.63918 type:complete len:369 (-) Transcript_29853:59-1165(-)|eukprot:CAMPEP_0201123558 /NCGR_PEP_ID=MMETSP0850-20130426/7548_1 /ASSEMBLY_ACC=CAM_ASM_000622 /TAXON_ID=183588 /ORGANISM="Pseudo-nitzschia fraudulenta, Strain WWA7" /LENGTH=368 /DNA_ID=CAMNT_0047390533 /DNA_START=106 /DNA_END=1212 /DNA_ORIENTATION=+